MTLTFGFAFVAAAGCSGALVDVAAVAADLQIVLASFWYGPFTYLPHLFQNQRKIFRIVLLNMR